MTGAIPNVIHQIYFAGESAIRDDYRRYRDTWLTRHPAWTYRFWDADACLALLAAHYPWFLEHYDAYEHRIQRCDAIRYFILHAQGGLYVDMDIENLRPVDDLIEGVDLLLSENAGGYTNAIMGSAPRHPLWSTVFDVLVARRQRPPFSLGRPSVPHYICHSTGPILLNDCVKAGQFDRSPATRVCPGYIFEPLAPRRENGRLLCDGDTSRSYGIHHMSLHWLPPFQRVTSALFRPVAALYWWVGRLGARG